MKQSAVASPRAWLATAACCLLLCSCSDSTPTTSKEPEKKPEPMTGQNALGEIYPVARNWSGDVTVVQLQSVNLAQVTSADGKAGAWEATLYSRDKGRARNYTWSAVEAGGNFHQGVYQNPQDSSTTKKSFEIGMIRTDSDAAYKTAVEKSGDYIKKNPHKPILLILEMTTKYPNPAWRIVWGESLAVSDYSVYVDATTGKFLEKAH